MSKQQKKKNKCRRNRQKEQIIEENDKIFNNLMDNQNNIDSDNKLIDLSSLISENKLIQLKESEVLGRYAVAAKDLQPGTVIIKEKPLIVGPCNDEPAICLGCYYNFHKDKQLVPTKCKGCNWPLCSPHCPGIGEEYGHSSIECKTLSRLKEGIGKWYAAITPLRCLLLEQNNPVAYKKLQHMASLDEVRCKRPHWEINQRDVVDRIRKNWKMEEFSAEKIHRICGILEVNAFEVGQHGISVRALYPTAFLLAHDCIPNTTHTDEETNFRLTIRNSIHIKKDEIITLSYAYTLQSTLQRRQHLFESKFFWCSCARCSDPFELGTNTGSLLCPRCTGGVVVSTAPLDQNAPWTCQSAVKDCPGYTVQANTIQILMNRITEEVEKIDGNDVNSYEVFLQRYRNVLHPNHYHFLGVKHSLSQLYGKISNYMIQELPVTLLKRKVQICKEILHIFNTLEPGLSRLRGITLYELHAPLMMLATRNFECHNITKQELRERLKEVVQCLREATKILCFEPDNSAEGIMACAAKDALHRIRDWEKILGKF